MSDVPHRYSYRSILGYLLNWQFSQLISFKLLTISSPTTIFRRCGLLVHWLLATTIGLRVLMGAQRRGPPTIELVNFQLPLA